ncbi:hypothetical protein [Moorena producens]|uniref:hypothetical protein n=1 Tax=Moorena producens TaxID=1155739 RepID=UPI0011EA668E|nr:hypothetical protein [Moorena producens]
MVALQKLTQFRLFMSRYLADSCSRSVRVAHYLIPECLRLPLASCLLPLASCLLPFASCLLPFAFCLLPCP